MPFLTTHLCATSAVALFLHSHASLSLFRRSSSLLHTEQIPSTLSSTSSSAAPTYPHLDISRSQWPLPHPSPSTSFAAAADAVRWLLVAAAELRALATAASIPLSARPRAVITLNSTLSGVKILPAKEPYSSSTHPALSVAATASCREPPLHEAFCRLSRC